MQVEPQANVACHVLRMVVVRSADAIWPFYAPLRRFSPADTILLLRPLPPTRSWEAELWRDGRSVRRNVTRLECTLLLAAWQSPLSSPGLDALADLR